MGGPTTNTKRLTTALLATAVAVLALSGGASATSEIGNRAEVDRGERGAKGESPSNGDTVVATVLRGTVRVKTPGARRFVVLDGQDTIPVRSLLNTKRGEVQITSISPNRRKLQAAAFRAGIFRVLQADGATLVKLNLATGSFRHCPARRAGERAGTSPRAKNAVRKLWGRGTGRFQTRGRGGAATIRGTHWLTIDRCDGTKFKVRDGVIRVRDFGRNRNVIVREGRSYLARLR